MKFICIYGIIDTFQHFSSSNYLARIDIASALWSRSNWRDLFWVCPKLSNFSIVKFSFVLFVRAARMICDFNNWRLVFINFGKFHSVDPFFQLFIYVITARSLSVIWRRWIYRPWSQSWAMWRWPQYPWVGRALIRIYPWVVTVTPPYRPSLHHHHLPWAKTRIMVCQSMLNCWPSSKRWVRKYDPATLGAAARPSASNVA